MLTFLLIAYLLVLLVAALPRWSYNRHWGYYPSTAVVAALGIVLGTAII